MKVIARHATNTYDVAIIQYATGNQHYWVITVEKGAEITGQETTFDRARSLDVARDSANLLWLRGMGRDPMAERVLVNA